MNDTVRTDTLTASAERSALRVMENESLPGDLFFWTREDWNGQVPANQIGLMGEFESACAVLNGRIKSKSQQRFRDSFGQLLQYARAAFGGEFAQIERGREALNGFKQRLVASEGAEIKNEYLKELAFAAAIFSAIMFIGGLLFRTAIQYSETKGVTKNQVVEGRPTKNALDSIRWDANFSPMHFTVMLIATMWGSWTSFYVRNVEWKFEQLQHPESDLAMPWSRLLATALLVSILALFFHLQVLVVTVGGVSTSQICENAIVAIFVGLSLGFLDQTLPSEVSRRIKEFFQQTKAGEQS